MIDDLDRCRPENVLEVLEAINFLATAGPCFVILGIDYEKVLNCVAYGFKNAIMQLPRKDAPERPNSDPLKPDAKELARFADAYLEKLINIVVPVPTSTAEASVNILTEGERAAEELSPWPDRVRRALRQSCDIGAGLACIAIISGLAFVTLASWHPETGSPTEEARDEPGQTSVAGAEGDASGQSGSGGPATSSRQQAGTQVTTATPSVVADDVAPGSLWLPGAIVALAMALVGLLVAGRLSTRREIIVEDSIDFHDALAIWSPVIFAVNPTPRGVKRYRNRLRFLAMRVRGEDVQPDWLDRLFGRLGHAVRHVATTSSAITEPKLVALGAIEALDPEILTGSSEERTARLADCLKQREHELGIPIGVAQDQARPWSVSTMLDRYMQTFQLTDWQPSPEEISVFRALARTVRD